jgi:hypothetical protein
MPEALPKKDEIVPREAITLEHPDFTANKAEWEFFRHSDELTGGYTASTATFTGPTAIESFDTTYLVPHGKEDSLDLDRRVAKATPPRFVQEGIMGVTGDLTQQSPDREGYPEKIKKWANRVNIEGDTLKQFIDARVVPMVLRYGHGYTYAIRSSVVAETEKEAQEKRDAGGIPEVLIYALNPENVPWWRTDDLGRYTNLRYVEHKSRVTYSGPFPVGYTKIKRHWFLSLEGWYYVDDYTDIVVSGQPLTEDVPLTVGAVASWGKTLKWFPVVKWDLEGNNPTKPASYAQLAYFRKDSELDNLETECCFPMKFLPVESIVENPAEVVMGPSMVGTFPAGGKHVPMILQPDATAFTHYQEQRLPALEDMAKAPYGRSAAAGAATGLALAHQEKASTAVLKDLAGAFEKGEFSALLPVAELLGDELSDEARISWPREFHALNAQMQMEVLTGFSDLEPGDEYKKEILKAAGKVALPDLSAKRTDECLDAWEADEKEKREAEAEKDDLLFDMQNQPTPQTLNPEQMTGGRAQGKSIEAPDPGKKPPKPGEKP